MSDEEKVKYVLEVEGQPKGAGVEIPGLGVFENGTHEITEQQAEDYRDRNPVVTVEEDKKSHVILGSNVDRGLTLLEASNGMIEGVTVSTVGDKPASGKSEKGGDK